MILFDWKKIYRQSRGNCSVVVNLIEYITYKPFPPNKQHRAYAWQEEDWSGISFMVKPELFLHHRRQYKEKELAQYVGIAALRNLSDYIMLGKTTLDLTLSPVGEAALKNNRLLTIVDNEIYLKWEEVAKEKNNGSI